MMISRTSSLVSIFCPPLWRIILHWITVVNAYYIFPKDSLRGFLKFLVFCYVNEWIYTAIHENHDHSEIVECACKVNLSTSDVEYQEVDFVPSPTEYEATDDYKQRFQHVVPCARNGSDSSWLVKSFEKHYIYD